MAAWGDGIKRLLSKIERKLPNVAEASQDLQELRDLFDLQLLDATALRSKFPLTYLHGEVSTRSKVASPIALLGSQAGNLRNALAESQRHGPNSRLTLPPAQVESGA